MSKRVGWEGTLLIDSVPFKYRKITASDEVDEGDTWDSGDGQFKSWEDCGKQGTIEINNATYDEEDDLFGTPLEIESGSIHHVEFYPAGTDEEPWDFPQARVKSVGIDADYANLQPVKLVLKTIGEYTLPGQS